MLYVPAAQGLDFTSKFNVTADAVIREDAETIYYGKGISCPLDNIVWVEFQIGHMGNGENNSFGTLECFV
jgi:hypothetical protein